MWYFFSSYGYRLMNPFNYCSSLVPFKTIYSEDLLSLYLASDKDEQDRRKYGILLYLTLKIFTRYWYQSFWYCYWSFVWAGICLGEYIYIGPSHTNIGASYGQVFVWVNDIDIGAYYINIGAYYINIGALWIVFGPYKPTLLIALYILPERSG